ncbi:MAG: efflux RND transporter periplasmic adaptor subunit [Burkholderiales bacterium]|nr:efflux RND transporter periplasmic adaptor subunit [Burkholderiales bacterium]
MSEPDLSRLHIERGATATRAKRRWARASVWLLALIAIAAGTLYWRSTAPLPVKTHTVATAYPSQAYTLLNATGYVVAQRKAAVASKATGRLEWLGVREGSSVRQGEVLARLENRDVSAKREQAAANVKLAQANLEQAQAELREAERAFERSSDLLARKYVSQAAHDSAIARLDKAQAAISGQRAAIAVAQANLRSAEVEVEQTLIRAPFDGVVLTKNANVGDVITPFSSALGSQAAVVTMADMSTLEVEADVAESSVGKAHLEQPCEIQLDALPDIRFRGVVARMVPTVDRAKATVTVKVRFVDKDPRVLPEMSARVAFLSRELPPELRTRRTVIDPGAIVERNGQRVVYVVREGRAVETPIETGNKLGDWLEVVRGLAPGDKVVATPPDQLRDGASVSLQAASG